MPPDKEKGQAALPNAECLKLLAPGTRTNDDDFNTSPAKGTIKSSQFIDQLLGGINSIPLCRTRK
jgi:hypothetical protein